LVLDLEEIGDPSEELGNLGVAHRSTHLWLDGAESWEDAATVRRDGAKAVPASSASVRLPAIQEKVGDLIAFLIGEWQRRHQRTRLHRGWVRDPFDEVFFAHWEHAGNLAPRADRRQIRPWASHGARGSVGVTRQAALRLHEL